MLDYMSDFGWPSAKGAHAVLCRMEEGKVNWSMTEKIDRIRRAHAQKVINVAPKKVNTESQGVPCKFFQSQKCPHKTDHHTGGQFYRHICSFCNTLGKRFPHPVKECRNSKCVNTDSKKRIRHCITAVQKSKVSIRPNITIASGNHVRTRVVSSNVWGNGESVNWKSDYQRYKGLTYAQVLQRGTKAFIAKKTSGFEPRYGSY